MTHTLRSQWKKNGVLVVCCFCQHFAFKTPNEPRWSHWSCTDNRLWCVKHWWWWRRLIIGRAFIKHRHKWHWYWQLLGQSTSSSKCTSWSTTQYRRRHWPHSSIVHRFRLWIHQHTVERLEWGFFVFFCAVWLSKRQFAWFAHHTRSHAPLDFRNKYLVTVIHYLQCPNLA